MAIIAPNQVGSVGLGRGSSISPVETYVRPVAPTQDPGLNSLADSLSRMGVSFAGMGQDRANEKEQNDLRRLGYYHALRKERDAGGVGAVQAGQKLAEASPIIMGRLDEMDGAQAAERQGFAVLEQVIQNPELARDPTAFNTFLDTKLAEAEKLAASGKPGFGAGYMTEIDAQIGRLRNMGVEERKARYEKDFLDNLGKRGVQDFDGARRNAAVQWETPDVASMPYLSRAIAGKDASHLVNLNSSFASAIDRMIADMPPELQEKASITSGFRSKERQAELFAGAVRKYGSEAAARKHVAPPGRSMHNHGEAVDWSGMREFHKTDVGKWVHANAEKYGLYFPMSWEPWHMELIGGKRQGGKSSHSNNDEPLTMPANGGAGAIVENFDIDGDDDDNPVERYIDNAFYAESGGDPTATNPNSSAGGLGQFVDSTWLIYARKTDPSLKSVSDRELISWKTDPSKAGFQRDVMRTFTADNADRLTSAGQSVTPTNLYIMHFAGEGDGPKLIGASDDARVVDVMSPASVKANPYVARMTVGEFKDWAAGKARDSGNAKGPIAAGQAAVQQLDWEFAELSPLNASARRDGLYNSFMKQALATKDTAYLDAMPLHMLTFEQQAAITQARQDITQFARAEHNYQRQLKNEQETDEKSELFKEINETVVNGGTLDLSRYTAYPEVMNYARASMEQQNIPTYQSTAVMQQLQIDLEPAFQTGDYSKIDPSFKDRTPSNTELAMAIRSRTDLRHEDKEKLIEGITAGRELAEQTGGPIVEKFFNDMVGSGIEAVLRAAPGAAMSEINGVSVMAEAKVRFLNEYKWRLRAAVESNGGQMPTGNELMTIRLQAADETKKYVAESLLNRDKPEIDRTGQPGSFQVDEQGRKVFTRGKPGVEPKGEAAQPDYKAPGASKRINLDDIELPSFLPPTDVLVKDLSDYLATPPNGN